MCQRSGHVSSAPACAIGAAGVNGVGMCQRRGRAFGASMCQRRRHVSSGRACAMGNEHVSTESAGATGVGRCHRRAGRCAGSSVRCFAGARAALGWPTGAGPAVPVPRRTGPPARCESTDRAWSLPRSVVRPRSPTRGDFRESRGRREGGGAARLPALPGESPFAAGGSWQVLRCSGSPSAPGGRHPSSRLRDRCVRAGRRAPAGPGAGGRR